jgi:predicted DNA-binding transcriptional regulator YafY
VLNLPAHRPPKFELARYWGDAVAEFESRINTTYATVRISPVGLQLLREVSAAAADAVDAMVGNAPFTRSVVVEIPIEGVAHATRQLLRLGAEVEVLKPATLRKAITREARAVLAGYGAALPSRNSK